MENQGSRIKMDRSLWIKLVMELKRRGMGKRESGAFLLGNRNTIIITEFICYDDLDPHAYDSGIIEFNGDAYIPLWKHCHKHQLKVLADVHTHPGIWTGQSKADMQHPMIACRGHIALIVPKFATTKNQLLEGVGIHEFLGERKWKDWSSEGNIFELIN